MDETNAPAGALTAALLKLLSGKGTSPYPVLQLQDDLSRLVTSRGYTQRPILSSSVPVGPAQSFMP